MLTSRTSLKDASMVNSIFYARKVCGGSIIRFPPPQLKELFLIESFNIMWPGTFEWSQCQQNRTKISFKISPRIITLKLAIFNNCLDSFYLFFVIFGITLRFKFILWKKKWKCCISFFVVIEFCLQLYMQMVYHFRWNIFRYKGHA